MDENMFDKIKLWSTNGKIFHRNKIQLFPVPFVYSKELETYSCFAYIDNLLYKFVGKSTYIQGYFLI